MDTFSAGACIRYGWEIFKKRPWFLIGAFLLTMIISSVISGIISHVAPGTKSSPSAIGFFLNLVTNTFVGIGLTSFALHAHDDVAKATLEDLWRPQFFLYYLCTSIVLFFIVALGFVLLIVPGFIALAAYYFSNYNVVDRSLGPIEAMKESARITRGHRWNVLGLLGLILLLNLLGILLLVVGLLVTIPVTMLAVAHAYRTLSSQATAPAVA